MYMYRVLQNPCNSFRSISIYGNSSESAVRISKYFPYMEILVLQESVFSIYGNSSVSKYVKSAL